MEIIKETDYSNLDLFKEEIIDGKISRIRITLDDLSDIGDFAYVGNTKNKLKKIGKDEFMFLRFEPINTHIKETTCGYTIKDIRNNIIYKLDENIEYGLERTKLVKNLIEDNYWIYELLSTNRVMKKEHKKKDSLLSFNQKLDSELKDIVEYLYKGKYTDEDEKRDYEKSTERIRELESLGKRKRTLENEKELNNLISYIQGFHLRNVKSKLYNDNRVEFVADMAQREVVGDFIVTEEQVSRQKRVRNIYKKDEISDEYWDKMYPDDKDTNRLTDKIYKNVNIYPAKEFRKETLEQMRKEIEYLEEYLGFYISDKTERKKHKENIIHKLNKHSTWGSNHLSGQEQYNLLRRMLDNLKGDYELSKKLLTDELRIKTKPNFTYYDINSDTWYEDENGELIEVSKNMILLNDPNTYKGLILNYKDLKDKYYDKFNSDIWALLMTFEDLLERTEFTYDEKFVLECLFENMNQTQIREKYDELNIEQMTTRRVSNLINNIIPNKILNTYLDSVEDWLYIYKLKGKYKTCSKCGEVKLISNDRYFSKDPSRVDGFDVYCKVCRSVGGR